MYSLFQKGKGSKMARKILTSVFLIVLISGGVLISKGYPQSSSREVASNQGEDVWNEQNIEHEKIWTSQPILSDLLYREGFADDLQKKVGLSNEQLVKIQNLATQVLLDYRALDTESRVITSDTNLTDDDKVKKYKEMGYNQRVLHEVNMADKSIKNLLTKDQYNKFISWVEDKYDEAKATAEEYRHKPPPDPSKAHTIVIPQR